MSDLISRHAAIDALCDEYCGGWQDCKHYPKCENLKAIQNLPPAKPEIIRCKDCKYAYITNDKKHCKFCDMFTDNYGELIEMYFGSNFYCGYAERRTDEE